MKGTKSPFKIGIWYLLALVLCYILLSQGVQNISYERLRKDDQVGITVGFDRNLNRYLRSDKNAQHVVFVGPSYAYEFGTPFGSYNLGVIGADSYEIDYIIRNYCRKQDKILYVFGVRESLEESRKRLRNGAPDVIDTIKMALGRTNSPKSLWENGNSVTETNVRPLPKPELGNKVKRTLTIARLFCRDKIGLESEQDYHETALPDEAQARNIRFLFDDPDFDLHNVRAVKVQLYITAHTTYDETAPAYFAQLEREFPNITYIFMPLLPSEKTTDDYFLNEQFKYAKSMESRFLQDLDRNKVDYINLSKALKNEDFKNFCHLKQHGIQQAINYLHTMGEFTGTTSSCN